MKQLLRRQITNIVFLVLIVAAALTIYLLSRTQSLNSATLYSETPAPSASPSVSAMVEQTPRGVPKSVFETHLKSSNLYTVEPKEGVKYAYTITYGNSPKVTAQLQYALIDGCISSIEISLLQAKKLKPKKGSKIDAYLSEERQHKAISDALRTILSDVLPACDAEDLLQVAAVRYWAEQAILLDKVGKDFEDTMADCRFLAYLSENTDGKIITCSMFFE